MKEHKLTRYLPSNDGIFDSTRMRYERFFSYSSEMNVYDEKLTDNVFASVSFKHKHAKELFDMVLKKQGVVLMRELTDVRLYSLLLYRLYVYIHNCPIDPNKEDDLRSIATSIIGLQNGGCHIEEGCYLKGYCLYTNDMYAPVRMSPGGEMFHPGYRLFTINLLCFREREVMLGIRGDGFIPTTLYHKGCKPVGVKKDAQGQAWLLMRAGMAWSDDHTAIFSNWADGNATLEICDWLSENDVRVIFRADI